MFAKFFSLPLLALFCALAVSLPAHAAPFSATGSASGDITALTIQGKVTVASSDVNAPGAIFVVATSPELGTFYQGPDSSWSPTPQAVARGALASRSMNIVETPTDLTAFGGIKVYAGYALCSPMVSAAGCLDKMNNNGTVDLIYTLPLKGKLALTRYTQTSANGNVAALASVANVRNQKLVYWGLKDANGSPYSISETLFDDPVTGNQTRTLYGTHGLPRKIINVRTGDYATIQWNLTGAQYRFYDAGGKYAMGFALTMDSSGKLVTTPLSGGGGAFAAEDDDIAADCTLCLSSLAQVKTNVKKIAKQTVAAGVTIGGTAVAIGSAPVWATAGATMTIVGGVAYVVADCSDGDCGPARVANLLSNLANLGSDVLTSFSKGWKQPGGSSTPSNGNDPQPEFKENSPQSAPAEMPSVPQADPTITQALAQSQAPKTPTSSTATCTPYTILKSGATCGADGKPDTICSYGMVADRDGYCVNPTTSTTPTQPSTSPATTSGDIDAGDENRYGYVKFDFTCGNGDYSTHTGSAFGGPLAPYNQTSRCLSQEKDLVQLRVCQQLGNVYQTALKSLYQCLANNSTGVYKQSYLAMLNSGTPTSSSSTSTSTSPSTTTSSSSSSSTSSGSCGNDPAVLGTWYSSRLGYQIFDGCYLTAKSADGRCNVVYTYSSKNNYEYSRVISMNSSSCGDIGDETNAGYRVTDTTLTYTGTGSLWTRVGAKPSSATSSSTSSSSGSNTNYTTYSTPTTVTTSTHFVPVPTPPTPVFHTSCNYGQVCR